MPCNFSFVDVDKKGVTGKGLRATPTSCSCWTGWVSSASTEQLPKKCPFDGSIQGRVFPLMRAGLHRRANEFKATLDCTCRPFPQRTPGTSAHDRQEHVPFPQRTPGTSIHVRQEHDVHHFHKELLGLVLHDVPFPERTPAGTSAHDQQEHHVPFPQRTPGTGTHDRQEHDVPFPERTPGTSTQYSCLPRTRGTISTKNS